MKKGFLFLLYALLLGSLSAELNQLRTVGEAEFRPNAIVQARYQTVNRDRAACLIFVTDLPTDLDFRPRVELVALTNPAPGQYHVYVAPDERVVTIHALGYEPLTVVLVDLGIRVLRSGEVYEVRVTGDIEVDSLPVIFNVTPEDALINVGALEFESGRPQPLPVGENEVFIEKEGYLPIREKINVDSENILFTYNLREIDPLLVRFRSQPDNAVIMIDNAERGTTDRDLWLFPGRYELQLIRANYITVNEVIEVVDGEENFFSWNLQKNVGTLNVNVQPSDAELFINNEKYDQHHGVELPPGMYRVELIAEGYRSQSERINMELRETVNRDYSLEPIFGNLLLEVFPTDTTVEMYFKDEKVRTVSGSSRITDLLAGNYELRASAPGFARQSNRITIRENETVRYSITLSESEPEDSESLEGMVFVIGGSFDMGSGRSVQQVTLSDFYIGQFPVSQSEWREVMGNNPSHFNGSDNPVERVTWLDAVEYCNRLSTLDGLQPVYSINDQTNTDDWGRGDIAADWSANGYRLPTEAEWEYAARGGSSSDNYTYSGSDDIDEVAWFTGNSGYRTRPVGQKKPNVLNVYDMSGNVWEWCWDWYGRFEDRVHTNPTGPNNGIAAVLRGGSWRDNHDFCRVYSRHRSNRERAYNYVGFRVARSAE